VLEKILQHRIEAISVINEQGVSRILEPFNAGRTTPWT
jgi:hypothetical protein